MRVTIGTSGCKDCFLEYFYGRASCRTCSTSFSSWWSYNAVDDRKGDDPIPKASGPTNKTRYVKEDKEPWKKWGDNKS